ncbi:hypothetical protein OIU34_19645 [Pararhizobium sp. BT-229]|uniref:hypothetical protein n=1 Tax=Pararhizobium sp. BT-229 TaxID=2986923 RepID=UPI0021F6AC71|nr:hypothetical protein [Pararhizobium sp. BT-229]MCV9964099.1 hypothetical protein [Pararhizobium sp. BT-229]
MGVVACPQVLHFKALEMLFRYPALVTGTPRGFRKPRLCVVVRETDIGITSFSSYDAPIAALLSSKQSVFGQETLVELPIRHVEGRFYIPAAIDRQALPDVLSDPFLDCTIRSALLKLLKSKFPVHGIESEGVWPQGIGLYLNLGTKFPGFEDTLEKSSSVVLTDEGMAQAAYADAMAEDMHNHFIHVDGSLWRRVPEPAFVASLTDGRLNLLMQDMRGAVAGRLAESVVFPLTAHDEAVNAMRLFGRVVRHERYARVFIPEAFSNDFHDVNYARFARHLTSWQRPDLRDSDLLRTLQLIEKITGASVDKIDFDLLEGLVEQALAEDQRWEAAGNQSAFTAMDSKVREFHIDLWGNRVVDIAGVVPRCTDGPLR